MHKIPILHRDNCYILVGRILLFVWDAPFLRRNVYTHSLKREKISLIAWDAYFHSGMPIFTVKIGHPDADIYVNIGIGVPIFA